MKNFYTLFTCDRMCFHKISNCFFVICHTALALFNLKENNFIVKNKLKKYNITRLSYKYHSYLTPSFFNKPVIPYAKSV